MKLMLMAVFGGFALPLSLIFFGFLFNKKLKEEDIRDMTDIPVVGNIPHSGDKINTVVFDNPNSAIAESFRLVRSKMQFFTKDAKAPIILVTSSMPEDGKTFAAVNIASVYSLLNKKTVLVGFDLRKPKIFQDFGLSNEKGVSTWLIGQDKMQDIIQNTRFENLSVISAGPIPPNPSELTALGKTEELFSYLRERYDYIIVDTSPIGLVSDTYYLASMADTVLLVARPGKTLKELFDRTLMEIRSNNTKGVGLLVNDIQSGSGHYGYGEKYGYTSESGRSKKRLLMKALLKRG
jgi:capsular exopolysaccharide synthesis family protein